MTSAFCVCVFVCFFVCLLSRVSLLRCGRMTLLPHRLFSLSNPIPMCDDAAAAPACHGLLLRHGMLLLRLLRLRLRLLLLLLLYGPLLNGL